MRNDNALLVRVFGQMESDQENIRAVAFEKAREMLKARNITMAELLNLGLSAIDLVNEVAETTEVSKPKTRAVEKGPYLHDRQASRFARTYNGKKIIRGSSPPNNIPGRLRVLKDVAAYGDYSPMRKLVLSFETDQVLYEPFEAVRSDPDYLATIRECSCNGTTLRFT